jgi:peptidoglycan/LPS O-acetylase OafA/YrhL
MLVALGVRTLDTFLTSGMAATTTSGFSYYWVLATMGVQGKFLEVFMVGMIASVLYVVTVEFGGLSLETRRRLGWVTLAAGIVLLFTAIQNNRFAGPIFAPGAIWGPGELLFPLLAGAAYSTLLLSSVWGRHPVRWFFETPPMRFIGLISYSLYLWHLPVIHVMIPFFAGVPLALRAVCAVLVAYLSYQLVERPFLKRRRRDDAPARTVTAPEPLVVGEHAAPAAARQ